MLSKSKPVSGDPAKKGGTCKQTSAGVDVRSLEDEDGDARYDFQTEL